ncbi:MAG: TetR/AcrR family transcriptional regulator [Alphaproteobacteria bacterium]|nr:TetR/AcrR family transcriptional regulator [Alphaproteobacteria bacterium]
MPKLRPETQQARREHILDTAEACFAQNGFHATTMQMICGAAGISPGALYVYFDSKEALIAGICERDRREFSERFAKVAEGDDVLAELNDLAAHYFVDEPRQKLALTVEIGAEAMRSEAISEIFQDCDRTVSESFTHLMNRLAAEKRIDPALPAEDVVKIIQILGDGLIWRRAVDPAFDGKQMLPAVLAVIGMLMGAVPEASVEQSKAAAVLEAP